MEQQFDVSLSLTLPLPFPNIKLKKKEYATQQHTCSADTHTAESWGWWVGPKAWGEGELATVCITSVPKLPHSVTINISTCVYHMRTTALGSNYILSLNGHNHQDWGHCHHQIIQRKDTQTPRGVLTHPRSQPVSVRGRIWAQVTLTPKPMLLSQLQTLNSVTPCQLLYILQHHPGQLRPVSSCTPVCSTLPTPLPLMPAPLLNNVPFEPCTS